MRLKTTIDKENKRLKTDRAKPSARSSRGDAAARVKTRAAARRKQVKESARLTPEGKARILASNKKRTEARLKRVAATDYTGSGGDIGRKFRKRTPAERAKRVAEIEARREKRLLGL